MNSQLPRDLLAQANSLALQDARKPKQVNLRRAISSAYYALFHRIIVMSCVTLTGNDSKSRKWVHGPLQRAFSHADIKHVCADLAKPTPPASMSNYLKALPMKDAARLDDIRKISQLFVEMQVLRHDADYNYEYQFERSQVVQKLSRTEECLEIIDDLVRNHRQLIVAFSVLSFFYKKSRVF
jgi:uncharacterized protein (UPF0332 family)